MIRTAPSRTRSARTRRVSPSSTPLVGLHFLHAGATCPFTDGFGRHHPVHSFVQRGYAVLMPNVRGSSGYGKAFEDATNDCWGHCDLEDVRAGVEFSKPLAAVNEAGMGNTGTSYGGILSMTAIAFAPGLSQSAIPMPPP